MPPREKYLEKVKEIVLTALKDQPVRVILFGSWTRGDVQVTSDIDVGLLPRGSLDRKIINELQGTLEESDVPYSVELVDLSIADEDFRKKIVEKGVVWKD